MARQNRNEPATKAMPADLNVQGAEALLAAVFEFLLRKKISRQSIINFARKYKLKEAQRSNLRKYREIARTSEEMGVIMASWFSNPQFLDSKGAPVPLTLRAGAQSVARLVRISGAQVHVPTAINMMMQSPSIKVLKGGRLSAARRVFVLPQMEIPRVAFVVERYLGTVQQISAASKSSRRLILERSCHVSEVDLAKKIPLLRDIEGRATAFMDSIDGDLEGRRIRKTKRKTVGELGVHVFTWTRATKGSLRPSQDAGLA